MIQKQLLISVLHKSCLRSSRFQMSFKVSFLKKYCNIHRKTTVLESLNKITGLKACKETPAQVLSCEYCQILIEHLFYRTPPLAASAVLKNL